MDRDTIGVIVARFQVPELHAGHRRLIDFVCGRHHAVLVVLASSGGQPTPKNPLPYAVREHMLKEAYPHARVAEIFNHPISPDYWSRELDALIATALKGRSAVLYGSRDSFLEVYSGKFPTHEVAPVDEASGTSIRNRIGMPTTKEGREALIYQARERYPLTYRTADIGIITHDAALLIGKKRHEGLLSFPGGFVDPRETDYAAAMRERAEEILRIKLSLLRYLGSQPIDDPRYRDTSDGVTTTFFRALYLGGEPAPGDDADSVHFVKQDQLLERLVPWHRTLGSILLANWTDDGDEL